jgi:hypothetical protein
VLCRAHNEHEPGTEVRTTGLAYPEGVGNLLPTRPFILAPLAHQSGPIFLQPQAELRTAGLVGFGTGFPPHFVPFPLPSSTSAPRVCAGLFFWAGVEHVPYASARFLIRTKIGPGAALLQGVGGGAIMPDYRIYAVGSDGRFIAVEDLECADDREAIKKATQAAKGSGIELREGDRCVVRLLPAPSLRWNLPTIGSDEP